MVAAELILKVGLLRLHNLEVKLGLPLYPIIGAGSAPFRGHLGPTNVERSLAEYPSAQTFTVQSAFKYDYDRDTVRDGIAKILAHKRTELCSSTKFGRRRSSTNLPRSTRRGCRI